MSIHPASSHNDEYLPVLEQELVLAAISLDQSGDDRLSKLLHSELEWSRLFEITIRHGIFPLFYTRIMPLAEKLIPSDELVRWNHTLNVSTQCNLRLAWKLVPCVDLLSENAVDSLVLKGPAYALQVYGELALRPYTDLDILIRPGEFSRVYDLLSQSGYTPGFTLDDKQRKFLLRTDNHLSFDKQGDMIEVHWGIAPRENIHPLTLDQIWQDLETIQVFEKQIQVPSLENSILYICMHGAKHAWKQLKWIVDLAYFCQSFSEDSMLQLLELAKRRGLKRQVGLGLQLAADLGNLRLTSKVRNLLDTDLNVQLLAHQVKTSIFNENQMLNVLEDYRFYFKTRERWQDRLIYLLDIYFLPKTPDWRLISLPENLYFLYYLIRQVRMLSLGVKAAATALDRSRHARRL